MRNKVLNLQLLSSEEIEQVVAGSWSTASAGCKTIIKDNEWSTISTSCEGR